MGTAPAPRSNRSTSQEQDYSSKPHPKLEPLQLPGAMLLFEASAKTGTAPATRSKTTLQHLTKTWNRSNSWEQHYSSKPHQKLEPLPLLGAALLFKTSPKTGTAPAPRSNSTVKNQAKNGTAPLFRSNTTLQNPTKNWNRSTSQEHSWALGCILL